MNLFVSRSTLAAAILATLGVFAQSAQAALVVVDVSSSAFTLTLGQAMQIDIDNSGGFASPSLQVQVGAPLSLSFAAPFDLALSFDAAEEIQFTSLSAGTITTATDSGYVQRLNVGDSVNWTTDPVSGGNTYLEFEGDGQGQWNGFSGVGYAPVFFDDANTSDSNYFNGWVEIAYNDAANTLTVTRFAYETTLNAAATVVPEPAVLSLFGLACVMVAFRRRRNS